MDKKRTEPDANVPDSKNSITLVMLGGALVTPHWRQWGALFRQLISTRKATPNFVAKHPLTAYDPQI